MPASPVVIDPLPTPFPTRANQENFSERAELLLGALPRAFEQVNAAAQSVAENATEAQAASLAAAAAAGAAPWVADGFYAFGQCARSRISRFVYTRTVAGASALDPANDPASWSLASPGALALVLVSIPSFAVFGGGHYIVASAGACVLTLPAPVASTAGHVLRVTVDNGRVDNRIAGRINGDNEGLLLAAASDSIELLSLGATGWKVIHA